MEVLTPDEFDFEAYMDATQPKAKLREFGVWADQVKRRFAMRDEVLAGVGLPWANSRTAIRFLPGDLTLWAGYSSSGKSSLLQMCVLGFAHQGEKSVISSFEMPPERVLEKTTRQGTGMRYPSPAQVDAFNEWTRGKVWLLDHLGRMDTQYLLAIINYAAKEKGVQHFVVDNLMMCVPEDGDGYLSKQKDFINELKRLAMDLRIHVHLVAHMRKGQDESKPGRKFDIRGTAALTDLSDNVLCLWRNKPKEAALQDGDVSKRGEPDATLQVDKCRETGNEIKLGLWFEPMSTQFLRQEGGDCVRFF